MATPQKVGRAAKEHERRKRLFKAALAYFDHTLESWSRANDLSTDYVKNVRIGVVESPRIVEVMDATIQKFQEKVAAELAETAKKVAA